MKAPAEKKRQQVIRGLQASARVDRERQQRKVGGARAYTTPKQGQVAAGARSAAPPLGKEALRVARIRKERAVKLERKMAREESERRAKAERDAPIQRKLERARRNQEKLEAKQRRENAQLKQAVRASWEQRPLHITGGPPSGLYANDGGGGGGGADEDAYLTESQQIEAAVMNSLADLGSREGAAAPPTPASCAGPAHHRSETPGPAEKSAGARGAYTGDRARRRDTAQYWDPVLDGPVPAGLSDSARADAGDSAESAGSYDDGVLAEAISVVEWDVQDEIPSETEREGFRRNMLVLLRDMLASDERHMRVRNGNPTFQANIGRWPCGRRLMRLTGFFMERETAENTSADGDAEYAWVARPRRPNGHLDMLHGLVGALEEQSERATALGTGGGVDGKGLRVPSPPDQDLAELQASTSYAFAAGFRVSSPLRLGPAAEPNDEFSRIRQEQDQEFEEALRRDRASLAAGNPKAAAAAAAATENNTPRQEQAQSIEPAASQDTEAGRSLGGTGVESAEGSNAASRAEETAAERRAKIAQSFARLGIGS